MNTMNRFNTLTQPLLDTFLQFLTTNLAIEELTVIQLEQALLACLFLVGFFGVVAVRNVMKKIFGLTILNNAAVILFILEGSRIGTIPPIHTDQQTWQPVQNLFVDPVPQALMLTAIVIGVCLTALALALAYRLYRVTGTFNIDTMYRRLGHDR
jgi:multicomponent Na+:H+ antiporter subunit C